LVKLLLLGVYYMGLGTTHDPYCLCFEIKLRGSYLKLGLRRRERGGVITKLKLSPAVSNNVSRHGVTLDVRVRDELLNFIFKIDRAVTFNKDSFEVVVANLATLAHV
jgi:hypothetical protein